MKKRLLSIITALALCLSLLPTAVLAEGADDYYTDVLIPWNQTLDGDVLDSRGTLTSAAYVADNGIYEIWAGGNVLQLQAYKEKTNDVMSDVQYAFYEKTTTNTTNTEAVRFRFHVVDETHITIQCIGNAAPYYNQTLYIFPQYDHPIDGKYLGWNSVSDVFLSDEPVLIELKDNDLKCVSTGRRLFSIGYPKFRKMQETLSVKKEQTFTYDGTVKLPVITGTNNAPQRTSEVNYGLDGVDTWYTKSKATEDAGFRKDGSYTAYIRVTRQKVTSSGASGQDTFVFGPITVNIVHQAQITRDAAAIAGLTYNGKAQELVSPAKGTGGTVKYSMDNANWSTDIPTAKDAGTYTVYYKVFGEAFNDGTSTVPISDSETKSVSVTIAKQALKLNSDEVKQDIVKHFTGRKLSPPCMKTGEYGTTSKIIPADAITYGGEYQETTVGEYTATVQPSSNYTWKDGSTNSVSLNWKISSRIINLTGVTAESRPYEAGNVNVNVEWDGSVKPINIDDDAQNALNEALRDGKFTITVDPTGVMEDDAVGTNKKVRVKATMTGTDEYLNGIKLNYIGGSDHQLWVFNCVDITKPEYTLIAPTAAENLTYDGTEKTLLTTGASSQEETSGATGITYSYRLGTDGTWSADIPTAIAAGTYDVYYRANETTNYAETVCDTPVKVTIKPCEIALPTDADLAPATYNGSEQTASLKESYAYRDKVKFTAGQVQTNADTYSVTLQPANSNYTWPNGQTTCTLNWTIAPMTIGIQWGNTALTYNGSQQAPTATATGLVGEDTCTITVAGGQTNAGNNYTATATGVGNSNYQLPAEDSAKQMGFSISPRPITISTASATNRDYIEGDVSVETDVTFGNAVTPMTKNTDYTVTGTMDNANAGTGKTVNVTVTLTNGNYSLADNTTTTVTISKIAYPGTTTATGSAIYGNPGSVDLSSYLADGGSFGTVTVTINNSVLSSDPVMEGNTLKFAFANNRDNVGKTAEITVPVTGATNYNEYTITVTVTVEAMLIPDVTAPTAVDGLVYDGETHALITAGTTTEGTTLLYSLNGTDYSTGLPTATNAGTYTVYYKVEGNLTYVDVDAKSLTVTIAKKEVTATPKDVTITRGSAIPAFELIYTGLLGEDTLTPNSAPTFTCYEKDGTTAVSTRTAAGSYTITWTNTDIFDGETNYRVVAATGTLTIIPTTPSQPTDTTTKIPGTGYTGIALYAGMALLSLTGGAWVVNKKRKGK